MHATTRPTIRHDEREKERDKHRRKGINIKFKSAYRFVPAFYQKYARKRAGLSQRQRGTLESRHTVTHNNLGFELFGRHSTQKAQVDS